MAHTRESPTQGRGRKKNLHPRGVISNNCDFTTVILQRWSVLSSEKYTEKNLGLIFRETRGEWNGSFRILHALPSELLGNLKVHSQLLQATGLDLSLRFHNQIRFYSNCPPFTSTWWTPSKTHTSNKTYWYHIWRQLRTCLSKKRFEREFEKKGWKGRVRHMLRMDG